MSIYNKGDERGILDDLAAFSIAQQPLDKTDFKVIRMEINNIPFIYNRFLKSFKKTKGGLQLLVRRKLAEHNETLKTFRENMKVPITKAAVSDLLLFFDN